MLVHPAEIPTVERQDFEQAIRANGKDPGLFKAQMFEATLVEDACTLRRVHVISSNAAAQYDASPGSCWTRSFARHLARGFYG
jgi:hypothetical protein